MVAASASAGSTELFPEGFRCKGQVFALPHTCRFGLIHYLYRLRIKTNYVNSAMFTDGPDDESSFALVQRDLRYIAASTLLVNELHVAQLVGAAKVRKWADDWLASNAPAAGTRPFALQLRRHLL